MMRLSVLAVISLFALACSEPASPTRTVINVRVRDDAGLAVANTPVRVMIDSAPRMDSRTGHDGTVDIAVTDAGVYQVWVVPKAGYIGGTGGLSRTVSVDSNSTVLVDFTVYRQGVSTNEPPNWIH